jgi:hypothetical protein
VFVDVLFKVHCIVIIVEINKSISHRAAPSGAKPSETSRAGGAPIVDRSAEGAARFGFGSYLLV